MIALPGSAPAATAVKRLTSTVPIVFATGGDPVALGLVPSLNRPGGNVTGVTSLNSEIAAKRIGLMRELFPSATRYFALINPTSPLAEASKKDLVAAAAHFKIHLEILQASTDAEIEAAFARLPPQPGNVLVFGPDAFFYIRRDRLAALAARHAMPSIFDVRDYAEAGGLISYGADFMDVLRLAGGLAGRVLKGENPGDLPVMQPTKFELVINLKTAKALELEIPPMLLARADAVIE